MGKLTDLFVNIGAKTDDFSKGISNVKNETFQLNSAISKVGGMIAGAFAVSAIVSFASEVSKLAAQAEGVSLAFERIGDKKMLNELREATKGTVNDLDLMKAAVQANNFNIPLTQLGSLLAFAHQRAKDTGQSVDYLVQSIVMGIGRKSPLILDNLGISAVALKEKMKGVASETASVGDVAKAVGEIAEEAMAKVGKTSLTTGERVAQMGSAWDNLKIKIGGFVNTLLDKVAPAITKVFELMAKGFQSATDAANEAKSDVAGKAVDEGVKYMDGLAEGFTKRGSKPKDALTKAFESYAKQARATIDSINKQSTYTSYDAEKIDAINAEVEGVRKIYNERLKTIDIEKKQLGLAKDKAVEVKKESDWLKEWGSKDYSKEETQDWEYTKKTDMEGLLKLQSIGLDSLKGKTGIQQLEEYANKIKELKQIIKDAGNDISNVVSSFVADFAQGIGDMISGQSDFNDFGKALLANVGKFMKQLGSMMISIGVGEIALKSGNPYAMIAGGVALVALGAAVSNLMASDPTKGGSSHYGSSSSYSGYNNSNKTIQIEGIVRGEDIYWSQKRAEKRLNNTVSRA